MKNERRVLKIVVLVSASVAALALCACNTVSGVGKDLQETSKNVKRAIEK